MNGNRRDGFIIERRIGADGSCLFLPTREAVDFFFFYPLRKLRDDRRQMRLERRNYERRVSGVDIGDHGNSCRQDWAVGRVER